ncbi:hypothetical protein [Nocardiopsis ansamitocini]|uniref:Alpha/beta hydrolase n=1 Tax=Nocardiopsis ansamitocini TaxID=1670832 RepID=A0A9W6P8X4_9ACTN|nr:hypothetical protein [Nocardiopsis ansamitocini]GLU49754.1 hypothetical protein Nans01_41050 [Nocardiopsis ansamitocini]
MSGYEAPGLLVLLHSPLGDAADWAELPRDLADLGAQTLIAEITDDDRPPFAARYVARAALEIAAAEPAGPVLLVAAGAAGPLLPLVAAAQRAAHRQIAGYVLVDALLPQPGAATRAELATAQLHVETASPERPRPPEFFTEPLPSAHDWPDAPCGYLRTAERYAHSAHLAALRGWPVREAAGRPLAGELLALVAEL